MNYQELVLLRFRESETHHKSFTQHLADTLGISYDAAYRRIQGKAKLDVVEAMQLAKAGQFSLDDIMTAGTNSTALGKATTAVESMDSFSAYLTTMEQHLKNAGKNDVQWLYSAKDIPIFHHFNDTELCRFKIYVWMQLLSKEKQWQRFDSFHLPLEIKEKLKRNRALFEQVDRLEIWNDTSISSSLQQIDYYHEAGFIDHHMAMTLCNDLHELINHVEQQLGDGYEIYYHELLIMSNNSLLYKKEEPKAAFVTMTMLGYLQFTGSSILNKMHNFYQHQLTQATAISTASVKERAVFFNKMRQKINALEKSLERFNTSF